jgi:hypothetical protein
VYHEHAYHSPEVTLIKYSALIKQKKKELEPLMEPFHQLIRGLAASPTPTDSVPPSNPEPLITQGISTNSSSNTSNVVKIDLTAEEDDLGEPDPKRRKTN